MINPKISCKQVKLVGVFSVLTIFSFMSLGCEPLHKKFVRERRKEKSAKKIEPILTPIDYPKAQVSAEKTYKYHYSLWMVYESEIISETRTGGRHQINYKKHKQLLKSMRMQLDSMKQWIVEEKHAGLNDIIALLDDVVEEYEKPTAMRNRVVIKRNLQRLSNAVRTDYAPKNMTDSFIN